MTRHSKNNTASSFFTSAERSKLEYGTQVQRLGRDSMRKLDCCIVCLQTAVTPVVCEQGHLFCRECIIKSVVGQVEAFERRKKAYEEQVSEKKKDEEAMEREHKKRIIEDFDRVNVVKRPKNDTDKPVLNAYWMPKNTPTASETIIPEPKKEIKCPAGDHPVAIKKLVSIVWQRETIGGGDACICAVCCKNLGMLTDLVVMRKCGHVFCSKCIVKANGDGVKDSLVCVTCSVPCKSSDLIKLDGDGTGFSYKGGSVQVKKEDAAFF